MNSPLPQYQPGLMQSKSVYVTNTNTKKPNNHLVCRSVNVHVVGDCTTQTQKCRLFPKWDTVQCAGTTRWHSQCSAPLKGQVDQPQVPQTHFQNLGKTAFNPGSWQQEPCLVGMGIQSIFLTMYRVYSLVSSAFALIT